MVRRDRGFQLVDSAGGLASGLRPFHQGSRSVWVGWPGVLLPQETRREATLIRRRLAAQRCYPVFLSRLDIENYYRGFSNRTVWPLFHYFSAYAEFNAAFWQTYRQVNEKFCSQVLRVVRPGDTIWVHDYHLMLLPGLLRRHRPDAAIGFFLHIPFPSFEVFRSFPWRREVLEGLLGADLVGFHSYHYSRHFLSSVRRILGYEHSLGRVRAGDRTVVVDAFPLGIDFQRFSRAASDPAVNRQAARLHEQVGDRRIILSVDRLDYTKGIVERLEAFTAFLAGHPEFRDRVTLIMLVVPSRTRVASYQHLKERIDELVGRINGEYGGVGWSPVLYLYRSVPQDRLVALYRAADVALTTPLRDGMNLVAKEYVATRTDGRGVLVLSEMAGAAEEMGEALLVNPYDQEQVVAALVRALTMPVEEQVRRNRAMQERLRRYDALTWARDFVARLREARRSQKLEHRPVLAGQERERMLAAFRRADRRLLLLDYDGTLVPFFTEPDQAEPDPVLRRVLSRLAALPGCEVVIVSGRGRSVLDRWLGDSGVGLVAEHGVWLKSPAGRWRTLIPLSDEWKQFVRPILRRCAGRTPGALLEEKEHSLVWHFRGVTPELAATRVNELRSSLIDLVANLELDVMEGNKVLEIRNAGVGKGHAVRQWLRRRRRDFILAAGDDTTDEDLFAALPAGAWSVKVGPHPTRARFSVASPVELRQLLERMVTGT